MPSSILQPGAATAGAIRQFLLPSGSRAGTRSTGSAGGGGGGGGGTTERRSRLARESVERRERLGQEATAQQGQLGRESVERREQLGRESIERRQQSAQEAAEQQGQLGREHQLTLGREEFQRKAEFAQPLVEQLGGPSIPEIPSGQSESESLLRQAQEEAGEKELNRLQDILSGAGISSSGTLARGSAEIIGSTRAGVARTAAGFAESRQTRRHQQRLAQQQQLTQLITSVLA